MSIQIQRVFVKEAGAGGRLSHRTPSNQTFDLVIEATADDPGDKNHQYLPSLAVTDLSAPATAVPAALTPGQPATTVVAGATWSSIGGRFEGVLTINIPKLSAADFAAVQDHLLQYFVLLRCIIPAGCTDADGAESDILLLS